MKSQAFSDKKELRGSLLKKIFKSEHLPFVTNRQIHHWKEIMVLDDNRKYAASGMKSTYNVYDIIWIKIISEMRTFRISNITIKEVKSYLYLHTETAIESKVTIFQRLILETICYSRTQYLVLAKNMSIKLLSKEEYILILDKENAHHHFIIDITCLVWEVLSMLDFEDEIKSIIQQYKTRTPSS